MRDKFLHFFFIVNVCLMIACAAVTIICFKEVEPVREPIVNRQPHIDLFFQASALFFKLVKLGSCIYNAHTFWHSSFYQMCMACCDGIHPISNVYEWIQIFRTLVCLKARKFKFKCCDIQWLNMGPFCIRLILIIVCSMPKCCRIYAQKALSHNLTKCFDVVLFFCNLHGLNINLTCCHVN